MINQSHIWIRGKYQWLLHTILLSRSITNTDSPLHYSQTRESAKTNKIQEIYFFLYLNIEIIMPYSAFWDQFFFIKDVYFDYSRMHPDIHIYGGVRVRLAISWRCSLCRPPMGNIWSTRTRRGHVGSLLWPNRGKKNVARLGYMFCLEKIHDPGSAACSNTELATKSSSLGRRLCRSCQKW